jgi:AI-2 transport protein TqsA
VALSFLELEPIWRPLTVLLLLVMVHFVTNNFVEPRLTAHAVDLSPLVALVALSFWGICWGVVGMVLAVPLTVMLKIIFENIALTRPLAHLMSGESEEAVSQARGGRTRPSATTTGGDRFA